MLYKTPQCAFVVASCKAKELKLPFNSKIITTELRPGNVWVGEWECGNVFVKPCVNIGDHGGMPFVPPAWFIGCTEDSSKINMVVEWKYVAGVSVPYATNIKALQRGDRLWREWGTYGACPPDVFKELARSEKKRKAQEMKAENKRKA